MNNVKVFAVIVTYKRAEILYDCLNAVLNKSTSKVYHVYIVVNSNDKATIDVIDLFKKSYPCKVSYDLFDNIGPAGGFHFGLKKFLTSDCDYVWLMDDDIFPNNDCLYELLKCSKNFPYIFPNVVDTDGKKVVAFGWWGVFLKHSLVKKVGLPIKDFFYWKEDTEYLQNRIIRKFKVIPHRSETGNVVHGHINKLKKPSWYYYYTIRNTIYYRLYLFPFNNKGRVQLVKTYLGLIYSIMFKENLKLEKLRLLITGTSHGLRGKFGKFDSLHN